MSALQRLTKKFIFTMTVLSVVVGFVLSIAGHVTDDYAASNGASEVTVLAHVDPVETDDAINHLHHGQGCQIHCDWVRIGSAEPTHSELISFVAWTVSEIHPLHTASSPQLRPPQFSI